MTARANALSLLDLSKEFGGGGKAVDRLSLEVEPGSILGLLGPSGCGKTTTLRMISGLIAPTSGRVIVGGRDVTGVPVNQRRMGVVFQSYALFPHLSVADNVGFGLRVQRVPASEAAGRIAEALGMVRLAGLEKRRPRQLSGGQQQRVALARALVIAPDILLLDEPLSNLDAKLREELRTEIRTIQRRLGITTVFVTHDQAEALALSDRVAVMETGRLAQVGSPDDIYERPASPFVARFIGRVNEMAATIAGDGGAVRLRLRDGRALPTPPDLKGEGPVRVMVRPHLIEATPAGTAMFAGVVRRRVFVGDLVELAVESDGLELVVETRPGRDEAAALAPGAPVGLSWKAEHSLVFPA